MNEEYYPFDFQGFDLPLELAALDGTTILFDLFDISRKWGERLKDVYCFKFGYSGKEVAISASTLSLDLIDMNDLCEAYVFTNGRMRVCWDKSLAVGDAKAIINKINQWGLISGAMRGGERMASLLKEPPRKVDTVEQLSKNKFLVFDTDSKEHAKQISGLFDHPEMIETIFIGRYAIVTLKTDNIAQGEKINMLFSVLKEKGLEGNCLSREQITSIAELIITRIVN